mmetsp:Transcript_10100/g.28387  ORF Transcript_10100/g.28387 Transcript_10100/m.28387 type:complete len:291 (-) Transcript_10100:289-1161(-)
MPPVALLDAFGERGRRRQGEHVVPEFKLHLVPAFPLVEVFGSQELEDVVPHLVIRHELAPRPRGHGGVQPVPVVVAPRGGGVQAALLQNAVQHAGPRAVVPQLVHSPVVQNDQHLLLGIHAPQLPDDLAQLQRVDLGGARTGLAVHAHVGPVHDDVERTPLLQPLLEPPEVAVPLALHAPRLALEGELGDALRERLEVLCLEVHHPELLPAGLAQALLVHFAPRQLPPRRALGGGEGRLLPQQSEHVAHQAQGEFAQGRQLVLQAPQRLERALGAPAVGAGLQQVRVLGL